MKKARAQRNRHLQKEQLCLLKIEKALELLLGKVDEAINALKVEELQLKSSAVSNLKSQSSHLNEEPSTSAKAALLSTTSLLEDLERMPAQQQMEDDVNQQEIDLDSLLAPIRRAGLEELEEDDDDEDESEEQYEFD